MGNHVNAGLPPTDPSGENTLSAGTRHLDLETLCALADGSLPAAQRGQAMQHVSACPACGRDYREIAATVVLLRRLPTYQPRKSFLVTPADARMHPQTLAGAPGGGLSRWIPSQQILRISAVVVGLVLCIVFAGDLMVDDEVGTVTMSVDKAIKVSTPVPGAPLATAIPETVGTTSASSAATTVAGISLWTVAELGLGLLLLWLLVSMAGRAFIARQDELPN